MDVGLATDGDSKVYGVRKTFSGRGSKFGWRIRLITHLGSLAVVHHRPSLFFFCYVTSDDVDPQRNQAAAVFDSPLEDNRRVPPAIERIHPGIRRSSRPGQSPCIIQQFALFYALQAGPTPAAVWALVVQAKGSLIIHYDAPGPQNTQFASETTTQEQEAKYSD